MLCDFRSVRIWFQPSTSKHIAIVWENDLYISIEYDTRTDTYEYIDKMFGDDLEILEEDIPELYDKLVLIFAEALD